MWRSACKSRRPGRNIISPPCSRPVRHRLRTARMGRRAKRESIAALGEERALVRIATLEEFKQQSVAFAQKPEEDRERPRDLTFNPGYKYDGLRLGPVHRLEPLHRLQRLRGGLHVGEQHRCGRQRSGDARPRHALDPHRHLLPGPARKAEDVLRAPAVTAERKRAQRIRLPGRRHDPQLRGSERYDL